MSDKQAREEEKNKHKEKGDVLVNYIAKENERQSSRDDQIGSARVYKKTSPNSVLTIYLPTRELVISGTSNVILNGIAFVESKHIQGARVFAQLTLTFRYGREDEEVMGLRFCNEAIMSLNQIWPRNDDFVQDHLTPLQDALIKRLGEGAHPFMLTLNSQAPPSVQLVPAKKYYGAPIGTSYDVRCFIAERSDEKFHKRATVKMGIRVIHRTDNFSLMVPENFASLPNSQLSPQDEILSDTFNNIELDLLKKTTSTSNNSNNGSSILNSNYGRPRKSERGESFPKIRLSPKTFRFSTRFGRSKSEVERTPIESSFSYSKSFQEYETCGGPQGAVDKPFLLQEGRVCLEASLDKSWYTHGEDIIVSVSIKNDSRKTVRRIRVSAIQHVDVCMFNNGKFKNVVADSDTNPSTDQIVGPGNFLNTTFILKPQRGPTKNWIALEDSLQRSIDPDEITGVIAASAIRQQVVSSVLASPENRNVFAIYVSYYIKVKLILSGIGGELSLKLPFTLVHIDDTVKPKINITNQENIESTLNKMTLDDQIIEDKKNIIENDESSITEKNSIFDQTTEQINNEKISNEINTNGISTAKRKLVRHSTVKQCSSDEDENNEINVISFNETALKIVSELNVPTEEKSHRETICVQVHSTPS